VLPRVRPKILTVAKRRGVIKQLLISLTLIYIHLHSYTEIIKYTGKKHGSTFFLSKWDFFLLPILTKNTYFEKNTFGVFFSKMSHDFAEVYTIRLYIHWKKSWENFGIFCMFSKIFPFFQNRRITRPFWDKNVGKHTTFSRYFPMVFPSVQKMLYIA